MMVVFGAMILLISVFGGVTLWQLNIITKIGDRIVDLRTPTSAASSAMANDINASLAALRGWMLTGDPSFKQERAEIWIDIDKQ